LKRHSSKEPEGDEIMEKWERFGIKSKKRPTESPDFFLPSNSRHPNRILKIKTPLWFAIMLIW
jgi:hypothetical protein